jgi:hypothetical protein
MGGTPMGDHYDTFERFLQAPRDVPSSNVPHRAWVDIRYGKDYAVFPVFPEKQANLGNIDLLANLAEKVFHTL